MRVASVHLHPILSLGSAPFLENELQGSQTTIISGPSITTVESTWRIPADPRGESKVAIWGAYIENLDLYLGISAKKIAQILVYICILTAWLNFPRDFFGSQWNLSDFHQKMRILEKLITFCKIS